MEKGFNTFRIPFLMERMSPQATGLTGPFDSTYLSGLQTVSCINHYTSHCDLMSCTPDRQLHHRKGWLCARRP